MGLIKSVLRDLTGIINLEKKVDENSRQLDQLQETLQEVKEASTSQEELQELENEIRDVRNRVLDVVVTLDMTDRQKDLIKVLADNAGTWMSKGEIGERLEISKNNVRTTINRMPDHVTIEETTQGKRGKKVYKITEKEKQRIMR